MTVDYWQARYRKGAGSGPGSEGDNATSKAARVHQALAACDGTSVVDLGCGDGQVAALLDVPTWLGVEVSDVALNLCIGATGRRDGWTWLLIDPDRPPNIDLPGDLAVSFDIIFHLDDAHLDWHLAQLFAPHRRRVLIRSTDYDEPRRGHIHHHRWSDRIPDGWQVSDRPAGTEAGFWELSR